MGITKNIRFLPLFRQRLWWIRKPMPKRELSVLTAFRLKQAGGRWSEFRGSYEFEPGFAPIGKTVLQVNVPQFDREYLYWKGLTGEEYKKQKKDAVKAITERVLTQFPGLQGHIEFLDCWTPMTYERYCNSYHGAYMGFITKKGIKSFRVKGIVKGVKNLYIASQWIMAPGGLPVAVTAGKFAVWRIARKDKREIRQNHSF